MILNCTLTGVNHSVTFKLNKKTFKTFNMAWVVVAGGCYTESTHECVHIWEVSSSGSTFHSTAER